MDLSVPLSLSGLFLLLVGILITAQFKRLDRMEDRLQCVEDSRYYLEAINDNTREIRDIIKEKVIDD